MYAVARRLLTEEDDAAEVVQDAWVRAVRGLTTFQWHSALRTWLVSIVVNCCRERWRSRGVMLEAPLDDLPASDVAIDDRLDLERAIARLPPGYRAIVVLHDVHGFTHEEIAAQLGVQAGTSKSQLSRARRALRTHLALSPATDGDA